MNKKIKTDAVDELFEAILHLKTVEECYAFFEDVCTVNELLSFSQRYEVARMLRDGHTYLDIAEKTGASTATISPIFLMESLLDAREKAAGSPTAFLVFWTGPQLARLERLPGRQE